MNVTVGIFIGGRSSRMGGRPKGLLPTRDGTTILERTAGLARELSSDVVLVGDAPGYASHASTLPRLADPPGERGPVGGLLSLVTYAHARAGRAIMLACDMPYLTRELLARLATDAPGAAAVAPRRNGVWEPFFARYDAGGARTAVEDAVRSGPTSLQALLDRLGAVELPLAPEEEALLGDWDRPEDVA